MQSLSNDPLSFRQIYLKTAKITDIKNKYTGKGVVVAVDNNSQYWIKVKFNGEKIGWVIRKLVRIINN